MTVFRIIPEDEVGQWDSIDVGDAKVELLLEVQGFRGTISWSRQGYTMKKQCSGCWQLCCRFLRMNRRSGVRVAVLGTHGSRRTSPLWRRQRGGREITRAAASIIQVTQTDHNVLGRFVNIDSTPGPDL